jgi:hypothetical protein
MKSLFLALAAFAAMVCTLTGTNAHDTPDRPGGPPPRDDPCAGKIDVVAPMRTKLTCEAYCLPDTAPRSSVMHVTWLDDARGRPGDSRIDVTVYKSGFDEGAYASFCDAPGQPQAVATPPKPSIHLAAIEGERSMQFQGIEHREARRTGESNVLVVRDLEPGVAYFWRAAQLTGKGWLASDVASCPAAVCPVDYVDEAASKRPRKKPPERDPEQKYPPSQERP